MARLLRDPHVSISDCATLAGWLEEFVAKLRSWNVRVADLGRLQAGVRLFRGIAQREAFPSDQESRLAIAHGARAAMDFRRVQAVLTNDRDSVLANDLDRAIKGSLKQEDKARGPFQIQSQLYVGGLFAAAGNDCLVPASSTAGPDFLIRKGVLLHGVEVKRPSEVRGLREGLKKAAAQLHMVDGRGVVSMDLSDLIETASQPEEGSGDPWKMIEADFDALVRAGRAQIFGRRQYNAGYSSVLVSHFFLRGWHWPLSAGPEIGPRLFSTDEVVVYFATPNNLWHHRGQWLATELLAGLGRFGHAITWLKSSGGHIG